MSPGNPATAPKAPRKTDDENGDERSQEEKSGLGDGKTEIMKEVQTP